MTKRSRPRLGYKWHLRKLMADNGMFATTDLRPLLAERGIDLSDAQIYRMVTGVPERLNLRTLMALCDILTITPNDLIEPVAETVRTRATGTTGATGMTPKNNASQIKNRAPRRADITPKQ